MKEAVIVSTARTPIGRAYKGAFNNTNAPSMAGMAIEASIARAGIDPGSIDCLLYTSPSPRDRTRSRMPSSA